MAKVESCSLGLRYVFLVEVPNCLLISFSHLGFWSGNFLMIATFPDHCFLVLIYPVRTNEFALIFW